MTDICPGRCNNRYRRAIADFEAALADWQAAEEQHAERVAKWELAKHRNGPDAAGPRPHPTHGERPEPPSIRPRYGDPIWCTGCTATIRANLAELDDLTPLHLEQSDGYNEPGDYSAGRVSGTQEDRSPSPGHDDLDELLEWLRTWEIEYRNSQRWPAPPRRGVSAHALTSTTAWHGEHLDHMLAHPQISKPYGTGVQWWHRRLQNATNTRPPLTKKPIPCRRCGRYSLFFHDDPTRPTVRCHADPDKCGLIMTVAEYDKYQDEYEAEQKKKKKTAPEFTDDQPTPKAV
ncbi:hypothetical protein NE236_41465 [Actinoallomurus purpureus]|uniref:hypothetical protein n=1 Tax=Actinoallomurus purpureus TaxID=478114 RepID=UPI002092C4AD|nr:hypothetical protein [Actinoallomurus purpureus]MCO6011438.1 hypothetical protein [Actinoallomurus purpureus]